MKNTDYNKLLEFTSVGGGFIPANSNAEQLAERTTLGEVIVCSEITSRDVSFHRCYMKMLSYIYDLMPEKFKNKIPKEHFYRFVQLVQKKYKVLSEFNNLPPLIEYESISFGRMSQKDFENYVAEQMPFIYENVIGAFYSGDEYKKILEGIEEEFEKFLSQL